jgi:hypothetical protein
MVSVTMPIMNPKTIMPDTVMKRATTLSPAVGKEAWTQHGNDTAQGLCSETRMVALNIVNIFEFGYQCVRIQSVLQYQRRRANSSKASEEGTSRLCNTTDRDINYVCYGIVRYSTI